MKRPEKKRKSEGRKDQVCSLKGGRVLLNGKPTNIPPLLAALIVIKDTEQLPSADYGVIEKSTSRTILRIASFLAARKALRQRTKGEEA